jgi:hypothetical protein
LVRHASGDAFDDDVEPRSQLVGARGENARGIDFEILRFLLVGPAQK